MTHRLACATSLLILAVLLLAPTFPAAADPDLARGRTLYFSSSLGGGTNGKCCFTCHEAGRDLSPGLSSRGERTVMGIRMRSPKEVVNFCIEVALRGEGIDPDGKEMEDLLAYLEYLARRNHHLEPSPGHCQP